jgi:hypothetical protein
MIHQILTDIQNKLKEVKNLRYIGEDWGQLEVDTPPVSYPCALVDVDGFNYSQTGNLEQLGDGTVYVRVADQRMVNISANAPEYLHQASIDFFEILDEIRKKLHGFSGENYSALIRTSFKRVRRADAGREYLFTFKTSYQESNKKRAVKLDNPQIKIESV